MPNFFINLWLNAKLNNMKKCVVNKADLLKDFAPSILNTDYAMGNGLPQKIKTLDRYIFT